LSWTGPPTRARAHVWLNNRTMGNEIKIKTSETVIDESEENTIILS
jgi:hypothetical protein